MFAFVGAVQGLLLLQGWGCKDVVVLVQPWMRQACSCLKFGSAVLSERISVSNAL